MADKRKDDNLFPTVEFWKLMRTYKFVLIYIAVVVTILLALGLMGY